MSLQTMITCCTCGCEFTMPEALDRSLRQTGNLFYCPSGHQQRYSGEVDKLKKQISDLTTQLADMTKFRDNARKRLDDVLAEASKPIYPCVVAGCDERRGTKHAMRRHLRTMHSIAARDVPMLPADAGPSS